MKTHVLEVELRDRYGNVCLTSAQDRGWTSNFQERIENKTGGMLCIDHMQIPQTQPAYLKQRWVVKVTCCCHKHTIAVEQRLYHCFSDDPVK